MTLLPRRRLIRMQFGVIPLVLAISACAFAQGSFTAVHVANAGVMLGCGEDRVLVDALFRDGVRGYETIPAAQREAMETARPPYDKVVLITITHRHADHFDAQAVARHLAQNPKTVFVGTPETAKAVQAIHPRRVHAINAPSESTYNNVKLRSYDVPHNPTRTGPVQHHTLGIEWCGKSLLFTGDADMRAGAFLRAGVQPDRTDILFAPFWITMSEEGQRIVREVVRPKELWALHGDLNNASKWPASVKAFDPKARIGKQQ